MRIIAFGDIHMDTDKVADIPAIKSAEHIIVTGLFTPSAPITKRVWKVPLSVFMMLYTAKIRLSLLIKHNAFNFCTTKINTNTHKKY